MKILAIDPGPEQSAFVVWDGTAVLDFGIKPNPDVFGEMPHGMRFSHAAIEMIASYGMAVGAEVFCTCVWIGRFMEQWRNYGGPGEMLRIPRGEIKLHLCRSTRAKDANVRQALIDRFGKPGTKKAPGVLYGISSHCWSALAVAVCAYDRLSLEVRNA